MRYFSIIFILLVLTLPAGAQQKLSLTPAQKSEIQILIGQYLRDNPAKLLEALDRVQAYMQDQEMQLAFTRIDENRDALYHDKRDISIGAQNAAITIVEFFDYNCGYCKKSLTPLLDLVTQNKDIRVIFKEFPVLKASSMLAAQYALALADSKQYLAFHTALMRHRGEITPKVLSQYLHDTGARPEIIRRNHKSVPITAHLSDNSALAQRLKIQGTPAFIVNDTLYPGALTKADWDEIIADVRKN